jgi:hypothetical protein
MNVEGTLALISLSLGCVFVGIGFIALWSIRHHLPDPQRLLLQRMLYRLMALGLFILLLPTLLFSLLSFFLPTRFFLVIVSIVSMIIVGFLSVTISLRNYRDFVRAQYPAMPQIVRVLHLLSFGVGLLLISGGVATFLTKIFSFSELAGYTVMLFCVIFIGSGAFVSLFIINKQTRRQR